MADTIAAIATGTQVSAIGIIRLSGDETFRVIDRLFFPYSGKKMSESADRRLIFGELRDRGGELLDVCLCTISRAPHSYTGENTAELQCHGSPTVLRAALDELFALGARQAAPGEFTKRAFLNGRMELCAAEAVADIIDAETVECAKNAAGQLSGAISRKVDGIYSALTDISSHYHAVLDYPDEDIEDFQLESYEGSLTSALTELERLLQSHERGKLMTGGIPAAIAGRPNAGKSSLLNALLGYDRAIVTAIPGTTRDTIEEKLRIGRLTLRLIDTAGIRDTDDEVERLGVERSRAAMSKAELVIAVVDGSGEITDEDREVIAQAEAGGLAQLRHRRRHGRAGARHRRAVPVAGGSGGRDTHERPSGGRGEARDRIHAQRAGRDARRYDAGYRPDGDGGRNVGARRAERPHSARGCYE